MVGSGNGNVAGCSRGSLNRAAISSTISRMVGSRFLLVFRFGLTMWVCPVRSVDLLRQRVRKHEYLASVARVLKPVDVGCQGDERGSHVVHQLRCGGARR